MRKMMTREVTTTTVKLAKLEMLEGTPQVVALPNLVVLGNVDAEKAQKLAVKEHGQGVSVLEVVADTQQYELSVEEFIAIASIKKEAEPKQEQE